MAFEVTVPPHAHDLIRKIAHASPEARDSLANMLMERPALSAPTDLAAVIKDTVAEGWPNDDVFEFVSQIFGMSALLKRGLSAEVAAKDIAAYPPIGLTDNEATAAASVLATILSSRSAMDLASAVAVYADYDHMFADAQVHVDVRTVFDLFERSLAGAVITHKLRIAYGSDAGNREFEVAMDADGLKKLRRSIERAEEDASKVAALYTSANLPIYSFDDED